MSHKDNERYYWFKLKESLLTSEKVDFLMRQKGGANYVVLYQCICLKLVNNNGVFAVHLGDDIYVPYTEEKIAGETKGWFSLDTIKVALDLYRRLGLVYFQEDGYLRITDFESLIGSETGAAARMREKRANIGRTKSEQCSPDIRYKRLDTRYKRKDIEKDIDKENEEVSNEEIDAMLDELYGKENNNG